MWSVKQCGVYSGSHLIQCILTESCDYVKRLQWVAVQTAVSVHLMLTLHHLATHLEHAPIIKIHLIALKVTNFGCIDYWLCTNSQAMCVETPACARGCVGVLSHVKVRRGSLSWLEITKGYSRLQVASETQEIWRFGDIHISKQPLVSPWEYGTQQHAKKPPQE